MKYLIIAFLLCLSCNAFAMSADEALVSDFITSDRACTQQNQKCEHRQELCSLMTSERTRELRQFIWNEQPYRAKNGGTNIMLRYQRALTHC